VAGLPLGDQESTLVRHGSFPVAAVLAATGVKVAAVAEVGKVSGVFVGKGVCVGVSVGGNGVAVGMAAWVSATSVKAPATAVFCTSAALIVGGASDPQALISVATIRIERVFTRRIWILNDLNKLDNNHPQQQCSRFL